MKQSFFFIIKDIGLDRVNLKIDTSISKIVYQSSVFVSYRPMGIFLKKGHA